MTISADFDRAEAGIARLNQLLPILNPFFNDVEEPQAPPLHWLTLRNFRERYKELDQLVNQLRSLRTNLEAAFEREYADLRTSQKTFENDQLEVGAGRSNLEAAVEQEKALLVKSRKTLEEDQHKPSSQRSSFTMEKEVFQQRSSSLEADQRILEGSQTALKEEQERLEEGKLNLAQNQGALQAGNEALARDLKAMRGECESLIWGQTKLEEEQKALKKAQDDFEQKKIAIEAGLARLETMLKDNEDAFKVSQEATVGVIEELKRLALAQIDAREAEMKRRQTEFTA